MLSIQDVMCTESFLLPLCSGHSGNVTGVAWATGEGDNQVFASSSIVSHVPEQVLLRCLVGAKQCEGSVPFRNVNVAVRGTKTQLGGIISRRQSCTNPELSASDRDAAEDCSGI